MKKFILCVLAISRAFGGSIGEDINAFAFDLFSQMNKQSENVVYSPYSVFSNLSLLYLGAQGDTEKEMQQMLHISTDQQAFTRAFEIHRKGLLRQIEGGYKLHLANGLFAHKGIPFLPNYQHLASSVFGAKLQSVDFSNPDGALASINKWVTKQTEGTITSLVEKEDLTKNTRLLAVNGIYFQGQWQSPFKKMEETSYFHPPNAKPISVEMLTQTSTLPYFENEQIQALGLPFIRKGAQQPMIECLLVLPKQETISIEESFSDLLSNRQPTYVHAQVPSFCLKETLILNTPLKALGMTTPFGYQANFKKIDGMKDLFLNKVLHESFLFFHENGLSASAATSSHLGIKSAPPPSHPPLSFIADRPFYLFIVDTHSQAILFMGQIMNPTMEGCNAY